MSPSAKKISMQAQLERFRILRKLNVYSTA